MTVTLHFSRIGLDIHLDPTMDVVTVIQNARGIPYNVQTTNFETLVKTCKQIQRERNA